MPEIIQRYANRLQREQVYKIDNGNCHYCCIKLNIQDFHVDHKLPYSKGGRTESSNLVASCYMCNVAKHTMSYDSFKKSLEVRGLNWRRRRYFAIKARFSNA